MNLEEQPIERNYPLSRILHVGSLATSAILVLVGIHILLKEEEYKYELYFYWFIAIYVIISMLTKMFLVVKSDLPAKKILLGFVMEFGFFLPIVLNDWATHKQEFALAMFLVCVARLIYYIVAVMKKSGLV